MRTELPHVTQILLNTPSAVDALIRSLPEKWLHATEGGDTWSCYDIVGHLIHGERTDWMPRLRLILEHGESQAFEPFDRFAQFNEYRTQPIGELLDLFATLRRENVGRLMQLELSAADLLRCGVHPDFGRVTLEQLLTTWVVHDMTHLSQISRVLAKQYAENVGPWKAYLSVLSSRSEHRQS